MNKEPYSIENYGDDNGIATEENQSLENFLDSIKNKKLVLFGAGLLAMKFVNNCLQDSSQVAYICDNEITTHGQKLLGIDIVHPDVLQSENRNSTVVVLCTEKHNIEIALQVKGFMKFAAMTVMTKQFNDRAHYFATHKKEFQQIRDLLCDNHSKSVWDKLNEKFQYGIRDFLDIKLNQPEYLPNCLFSSALNNKEIVVSAGVCDGSTTKRFCDFFGKRLAKLYAFEPITSSFNLSKENLCEYYAEKYPINMLRCGLSDEEGMVEMAYSENNRGSARICDLIRPIYQEFYSNFKKEIVQIRPLDNIIPENEKITFIKMDIEGAETKALLGAKRIIQRDKPRLAICIYHNAEDYFNIPLMIKDFVPEYKFYLRHHGKIFVGSVIYATV